MSQIMKVFTGVFMVLFLMISSSGVLGAFCQILRAQNTHAAMIDELENSNYAESVIEACFDTAKEEGYQLQLSLYTKKEFIATCVSKKEVPENLEEIQMMEVVLRYPIQIAFFDIDVEQQLFGYAR